MRRGRSLRGRYWTKSFDDETLAAYIRKTSFETVIGPIAFGRDGEWTKPRIICIQFQGITGGDLDQFRDWSRQTVVYPSEFKSGSLIYPFEKAAQ
jgi:branched-chain amino acid transport system substrate-binding protein